MWKDDDEKINHVLSSFLDGKRFPVECPSCKKNCAHIYMHIYNEDTRRGGLWVWCSECNTFSHSSLFVPINWENCLSVDVGYLAAVPDYLDGMRDVIDEHVNQVLDKE